MHTPEPDRARAGSAGAPPLAVQPFRLDASRLELYQVDLVNSALLPPISAASPPPLVLPEVTFTEVMVYTAGLFGAQLAVPDLRLAAGGG